jgi:hypothetical protein
MSSGVRVAGVVMVLWLFLFAGQGTAQQMDDCFITKEQLKTLLDSPDMTLIDMRFGRDWYDATLKIKGAVERQDACLLLNLTERRDQYQFGTDVQSQRFYKSFCFAGRIQRLACGQVSD